jgi:hypothetical protein
MLGADETRESLFYFPSFEAIAFFVSCSLLAGTASGAFAVDGSSVRRFLFFGSSTTTTSAYSPPTPKQQQK